MAKETILVKLSETKAHHPGFAVCYARGSVFRPEGKLFRVVQGKRAIVSRVLCTRLYYRGKCKRCPHSRFEASFKAVE